VAPLSGVRVLDFTIWRPGPYATQLLCELGADVLKVEPPTGDPMRSYPSLFAALNAGKRGIALDLKDGDARAEALALAAEADVVVESYRPGVAERLGIGAAAVRAVKPDVVYCSVSGMGQTGPLAQAPGHDLNYMAWAGALAPDGELPRVPAIPVADLSGGMAAALSVAPVASGSTWRSATCWPRGRVRWCPRRRGWIRRPARCPATACSRLPTGTTSLSAC
jgi:crotonobetainyl-CoA:carnitine CoA-transferase CaiB-like acyl-CoA transferase